MTPEIWLKNAWEDDGSRLVAAGLGALSVGYRLGLRARNLLYGLGLVRTGRLSCPVVSIGNVTLGGSGKTPLVEAAAATLLALGASPAVVSRGYGRRSRGVQVVADRAGLRLDATMAGDEPVLLATRLRGVPVVVGEDRYEAGVAAVQRLGADCVVLDDGFQNRTVAKDLEVLAVNGRAPWGNGRLFPRGPLREPLEALRRAHVVVVTNAEGPAVDEVIATLRRHGGERPVAAARYEPEQARQPLTGHAVAPSALRGRRLWCFAGLGSPAGFFATVRTLGVDIAGTTAFPDHHWYTLAVLDALVRRARAAGATGLLTSEKDWMRLQPLPAPALPLWVLSVRLVFTDNETAWLDALRRVGPAPSRSRGG
jgi:tetraacyldisaccharide 4'-kinase